MKQQVFFVQILREEKTTGSPVQSLFRLSKYETTPIVRKISKRKAKQEERNLWGKMLRLLPANRAH